MKRIFWKWIYSGVIYKINAVNNTAEVIIGDKFTKVGTIKSLNDLKKPGSDEGKPFKTFFTLEDAQACANVII